MTHHNDSSTTANADAPSSGASQPSASVAQPYTDAPTPQIPQLTACTWIARIGFAIVFAINVQCALSFIFAPGSFTGAYELSGVAGNVAVQGLGVAFLMWNVPYAVYMAHPARFCVLGWVAIAQQAIGLLGESLILASIPAGHTVLADSILRFIAFDALGLVIMLGVHCALFAVLRKVSSR